MAASSFPALASDRRSRSRPWLGLVLAGVGVGLLVAFPPVRIVRLRPASLPTAPAGDAAPAAFVPVAFAEAVWASQFLPAAARAPELAPVLEAWIRDPAAAAERHGHRVGLGSASHFFVRGSGRVVAVERSRVMIDVGGSLVAIRTGPVFGNAVRDGCGLLDVNQVPGLAEFNAVSAELNRLVEQRVQPPLKALAAGARVQFAGAAEVPETVPADGPLLTFIPIRAEVSP